MARSFVLAVGCLLASAIPAVADPWALLDETRERWTDAVRVSAEFTQTYLPPGFPAGDTETGRIVIALPECLRWDYREPFPKSFLLCGETLYQWLDGETRGRLFTVDPAREPGLDLLLLPVDELRPRYVASLEVATDGRRVVSLQSGSGEEGGPQRAQLVFAADEAELVELVFWDRDGGESRFVFGVARPEPDGGLLEPPEGLLWQEGG